MVNIPGIENINFTGAISGIMYWTFWGLIAVAMLVVMIAIYFYSTFNIKATVFPLYGSGRDGIFSVGKAKSNRVKWIKKQKVWLSMWPLFNKKNREPFDSEYIYPNKRIYVFDLNNEWIPGRVNIDKNEETIRCSINPVPYYIRNWADAESRIDELEFSKQDWWTENKMFVYMLIAVAICCTMCVVTIYFSYKFGTGATEGANRLADALKNFGNIPGKPMG